MDGMDGGMDEGMDGMDGMDGVADAPAQNLEGMDGGMDDGMEGGIDEGMDGMEGDADAPVHDMEGEMDQEVEEVKVSHSFKDYSKDPSKCDFQISKLPSPAHAFSSKIRYLFEFLSVGIQWMLSHLEGLMNYKPEEEATAPTNDRLSQFYAFLEKPDYTKFFVWCDF